MDIMAKLGSDIASLWSNYAGSYLNGIANTLLLALAATLNRLRDRLCVRRASDDTVLEK